MSLDKATLALIEKHWPFLGWLNEFKVGAGVEVNSLFDLIWESSGFSSSVDYLQDAIDDAIKDRTKAPRWTPEVGAFMHLWTDGISKGMESELRARIWVIVDAMLANPGQYGQARVKQEVNAAWASVLTKNLAYANGRLSTLTEIQESYYRPFMRRYFIMNIVYRALGQFQRLFLNEVLTLAWRHLVATLGKWTGTGTVHQVVGFLLRGAEWMEHTAVHPLDRAWELIRGSYQYLRTNWRGIIDWVREAGRISGRNAAVLGPAAVGVVAKAAPPILGLGAIAAGSFALGYYLARGAYEVLKALGVVGGLPEATDENFARVTELPLGERSAVQAEAERVGGELTEIASSWKSLVDQESKARLGEEGLSGGFAWQLDQLEGKVRRLQSSYGPGVVGAIQEQLLSMIAAMRGRVGRGGYVSGALTFGAAEGEDMMTMLEGVVGVADVAEYLTPAIVADLEGRGLMDPSEEEVAEVVARVCETQQAGLQAFVERRLQERLAGMAAPPEEAGVAEAAGVMDEVARLVAAKSTDKNAYILAARRLTDLSGLPAEAQGMVDETVSNLSEFLAAWGEPRGGGARTPEESAAAR